MPVSAHYQIEMHPLPTKKPVKTTSLAATPAQGTAPGVAQNPTPVSAKRNPPPLLFISYAHEDESWRRELGVNLDILRGKGLVEAWFDQRIGAGQDWNHEIHRMLKQAQIILFLVSRHLLASQYIQRVELEVAMQRHRDGTARVVPVILSACSWQQTPLAALQALPREARPVEEWRYPSRAFNDIEAGIRQAAQDTLEGK
jgi:hypothetical protein